MNREYHSLSACLISSQNLSEPNLIMIVHGIFDFQIPAFPNTTIRQRNCPELESITITDPKLGRDGVAMVLLLKIISLSHHKAGIAMRSINM